MNSNPSFVRCIDPTSKKLYYFNQITHEALWKLPHGIIDSNDNIDSNFNDPSICNYFAKVIVQYEKSGDNEISLAKDDIVHVLRVTQNGWAAGLTRMGGSGYFPLKCTTPITPPTMKRNNSLNVITSNLDTKRNFMRDTTGSHSSTTLRHSARISSEIIRLVGSGRNNQCQYRTYESIQASSEDIVHRLYKVFIETVFLNEKISKNYIIAIEAIRQKYRIPLTVHLSILSEIEDGITIYAKYLKEYEILNKREIRMLYFNDNDIDNSLGLLNASDNLYTSLSYNAYNMTNINNLHRPFVQILPNESIYKLLEQTDVIPFDFPFEQYAKMYFSRDRHIRISETELYAYSPNAPNYTLLPLYDQEYEDSIVAKELIMMYMRDLPITGNPSSLLERLSSYVNESSLVCDECYCFLIKQTISNILQRSETRGWELLNYLISVRFPSYRLFPYVLYHICKGMYSSEIQLSGLKVNALYLITGQVTEFQLSQSQLDHINKNLIRSSVFDVTLEECLLRETVCDLQAHYNLLLPSQQLFGSRIENVMRDFYLVTEKSNEVLQFLLQGAMFVKRTVSYRSQKSRYMRLGPGLNRLIFSRTIDEIDDEIELSNIISIEMNIIEKNQSAIILNLINKKAVFLQCELDVERNRWLFYLKVLLAWYHATGYNLISSVTSKLDNEDQKQYASLLTLHDLPLMNNLVIKVVEFIHKSFLAFITEKTEAPSNLLPFNIDLSYHLPKHTVPYFITYLISSLARCRGFLITETIKLLPMASTTIIDSVYNGDYKCIEEETNPFILLSLLRNWFQSVKGFMILEPYLRKALDLVRLQNDEAVYQYILTLPDIYRDTVLYLSRIGWEYSQFRYSSYSEDDEFVKYCAYLIVPKSMTFDDCFNLQSLRKLLASLFRSVGIHKREAFLPPDPTLAEMDKYKVLLYSKIPPTLQSDNSYNYTIENLYKLEKTAELMFQYGLLPHINTFGCSSHQLPEVKEDPIYLFGQGSCIMMKKAVSWVYELGNIVLNPFVNVVICKMKEETRCIKINDIDHINDMPSEGLLEYEQSSIQGRCLSLITLHIRTCLDLLCDSHKKRNALLNGLDLCIEWNREEAKKIWKLWTISDSDHILIQECKSLEDVQQKCPHLLPLVESLQTSFIQFVRLRVDRSESLAFGNEVKQEIVRPKPFLTTKEETKTTNPDVLKIFVVIAEALVRIKAHCEEGVFRQPGAKEQGLILKEKVRNGDYECINEITGFKELTSLLTSVLSFNEERLIPISFLPNIIEVNKLGDAMQSYQVLCSFPSVNRFSLLYICHMWYEFSRYSSINKMTIDNICKCVCPVLIYVKDQFLQIVTPLYTFVKMLILASNLVDLDKMNIRLSVE